MADFPNVHYDKGSVHIRLDLRAYGPRLKEGQQWLGDRVLEDCKPHMPILTGNFQQLSHVEDGGKKVRFPGPSAGVLYRGKVMVDAATGKGPRKIPTGPGEYILRFRKGAKLIPSSRPMSYSSPDAVPEWFEVAKQINKQFWIEGVAEILEGR